MEAELQAITAAAGTLTITNGTPRLTYRTYNIACAKETLLLLKRRFGISTMPYYVRNERLGGRRTYVLQLSREDSARVLGALDLLGGRTAGTGRMFRRICCRRAYLKGAFLSVGTITQPERAYRVEFAWDTRERAAFLIKVLAQCGVPVRLYDTNAAAVESAIAQIGGIFGKLAEADWTKIAHATGRLAEAYPHANADTHAYAHANPHPTPACALPGVW